jgi:hypothetical protein
MTNNSEVIYQSGKMILYAHDLEHRVKIRDMEFSVKIQLPRDRENIISLVARKIGADSRAITDQDYQYVARNSYLDVAIIGGPEWWEKHGFSKCPDEELLWELYDKCLSLEKDFQKKIRTTQPEKNSNCSLAGRLDNVSVQSSAHGLQVKESD